MPVISWIKFEMAQASSAAHAALRALVEPTWVSRIFLPYDHLLEHGTVVRDHAAHVTANRVVLTSGQRLTPGLIVLATGSTYPFPAKSDQPNTVDAIGRYRAAHANLTRAHRVMLLGAGPVGLELAGEIAAVWPDKHIVLVDLADQVLPGPYDQRLRDELNRQLDNLGVERVLGNPLTHLPDTPAGEARTFTVATTTGTRNLPDPAVSRPGRGSRGSSRCAGSRRGRTAHRGRRGGGAPRWRSPGARRGW